MKISLLPFLGVIALSILLFSCGSFADPEFKGIENIKIGKLGLGETTLNLEILYTNPNKTRLKLKKAEGEAWVENSFLGYFWVDTLIIIPARGDFRLPVKLKVDLNKILKSSLLAFLSPEVLIKLNGKAKVGKGLVYINYPIKYEGKQNLRELIQ